MATAQSPGEAPRSWPALRKFANETDVTVVGSWDEWMRDIDLSGFPETGMLVTIDGEVYDLVFEPAADPRRFVDGREGFLRPVSRGERFTASQWVDFVRPHVEGLGPQAVKELEALADPERVAGLPAGIVAMLRTKKKR